MIQQWKTKPAVVRVAGPWDGSPEKSADFAELFDDKTDWDPESPAEYWDERNDRWTNVHRGWYLVRHEGGWIRAVDEKELRELYEPDEAEECGECEKPLPPGTDRFVRASGAVLCVRCATEE